jgi:hypothetical protein
MSPGIYVVRVPSSPLPSGELSYCTTRATLVKSLTFGSCEASRLVAFCRRLRRNRIAASPISVAQRDFRIFRFLRASCCLRKPTFALTRTYLKTSKLPEKGADGCELSINIVLAGVRGTQTLKRR